MSRRPGRPAVVSDRPVQVTLGTTVVSGPLSHLLAVAQQHAPGNDAAVMLTLHSAECDKCTATQRWVPEVIQGGEAPSEGA
jgi:hypothetical protein